MVDAQPSYFPLGKHSGVPDTKSVDAAAAAAAALGGEVTSPVDISHDASDDEISHTEQSNDNPSLISGGRRPLKRPESIGNGGGEATGHNSGISPPDSRELHTSEDFPETSHKYDSVGKGDYDGGSSEDAANLPGGAEAHINGKTPPDVDAAAVGSGGSEDSSRATTNLGAPESEKRQEEDRIADKANPRMSLASSGLPHHLPPSLDTSIASTSPNMPRTHDADNVTGSGRGAPAGNGNGYGSSGNDSISHNSNLAQLNRDPNVRITNHSNVEILEYDIQGVNVMRRVADNALNATQILRLAGLDKAKRTKIIENELVNGAEKVQGGHGKYQGTWVVFDRGVALCQKFGVAKLLEPLLLYDTTSPGLNNLPNTNNNVSTRQEDQGRFNQKLAESNDSATPTPHKQKASLGQNDSRQLQSIYGSTHGDQLPQEQIAAVQGSQDEAVVGTQCLPPLEPTPGPESYDGFERTRDIVTELFLNESRPFGDILTKHSASQVQVDVPIDDHGHTALHWASSLGRVDLVRDLVNMGANYARGNYAGESPLVRAVLVTNNSDLSTFGDLLDILYPCMHLADRSGRTVLHHISLTAGIKGRSDASRYYLETLLEWVVRNDPQSQLGVNWLIEELVNAQDNNGDTALNIAARIGNTQIARQLIDVGASVVVPNRAGLRPVDFGIELPSPSMDPRATLTAKASTAAANAQTPKIAAVPQNDGDVTQTQAAQSANNGELRLATLAKLQNAISSLETGFDQELTTKNTLFASVHEQLKEATISLNNYKSQHNHLQSLINSFDEQSARVEALTQAIRAEDANFRAEADASTSEALDLDAFDADQPFRIDSSTPASALPPPVLLRARIEAYKLNEARLIQLRDELRDSSLEREHKFRRVVSQCTGVDESKIDGLLLSLVQAVESDSGSAGNVDLSRVAGFLESVRR